MDIPTQLSTSLAGRYVIEREIGRGGMATVYLARDLRHDRLVALKVLNPELGAVLGVDRFLSEIKVTANLQHPNLLPLFDSGEADGLLFYVMPAQSSHPEGAGAKRTATEGSLSRRGSSVAYGKSLGATAILRSPFASLWLPQDGREGHSPTLRIRVWLPQDD